MTKNIEKMIFSFYENWYKNIKQIISIKRVEEYLSKSF
jgi:hypothetical protein